jgi:hypothetical protein
MITLLALVSTLATSTAGTAQMVPLNDLGAGTYQGAQGGLYPGGTNTRPAFHHSEGLIQAGMVVPRDANGAPQASGRVVLLTIGMSNTRQESQRWGQLIASDPDIHPRLSFVNGAQGGQTAAKIADENGAGAQFWANIDTYLSQAGLTRAQVQAVWIKQANAGPTNGWPAYAQELKGQLVTICQIVRRRFPNCRLAYLSSRIYAGYATTALNPEPYAYESGFSVKWLVQDQIQGSPDLAYGASNSRTRRVNSPWLSWGPYLWANGTQPRSDGLIWVLADFQADGTHPSGQGAQKVAQMLHSFFRTDPTTRSWYLKP